MVSNGVSPSLAFSLDDVEATAWAIIFSEFNGNEFDWNNMRFKESTD